MKSGPFFASSTLLISCTNPSRARFGISGGVPTLDNRLAAETPWTKVVDAPTSGVCGPATAATGFGRRCCAAGFAFGLAEVAARCWSAFFARSTAFLSLGGGSSVPPTPGVITYVGPGDGIVDGFGSGG